MSMRNRGDIALYTTLIVSGTILASALMLTSILSQQVKFTHDITSSERAFYAANTGYEESFYNIVAEAAVSNGDYSGIGTKTIDGKIYYQFPDGTSEPADYFAEIKLVLNSAGNYAPCGYSRGTYLGITRRLEVGNFESCWTQP